MISFWISVVPPKIDWTWLSAQGSSWFRAHKPGPILAVVIDAAVTFNSYYIDKPFAQRFPYLFRRKRYRPDDFCERFVSAVWLELKYFDAPVEHYFIACSYPYVEVVITESLNCPRDARHHFKAAYGIGVEDKNATIVQVPVRAAEKVLPG